MRHDATSACHAGHTALITINHVKTNTSPTELDHQMPQPLRRASTEICTAIKQKAPAPFAWVFFCPSKEHGKAKRQQGD